MVGYVFAILFGIAVAGGLIFGAYLAKRTDFAATMFPQVREARKDWRADDWERSRQRQRRLWVLFVAFALVLGIVTAVATVAAFR